MPARIMGSPAASRGESDDAIPVDIKLFLAAGRGTPRGETGSARAQIWFATS